MSLVRCRRGKEAWYRTRALIVFAERLGRVLRSTPQFRALEPKLRLRRMRRRWGSCSRNGTITLNLELIKAPTSCVDYVILHELCHLIEASHSRRFYELLSQVSPEWEKLRERLNLSVHS